MKVFRYELGGNFDGVYVEGIEGTIGKGNKVLLDVERSNQNYLYWLEKSPS